MLSMPGSELSLPTGFKWEIVPEAAAASPALRRCLSLILGGKKFT